LPQHFPPELLHGEGPRHPFVIDLNQPLPTLLRQVQADIEQEYIRKALEQSRGNVSQCAQICGISRRSLSAKLGAYQINKTIFKEMDHAAPAC
jgi:DNA-binding NtrC family response regulator